MTDGAAQSTADAHVLAICGHALAAARPLCGLSLGLTLVAAAGVALAGAFAEDVRLALAAWVTALAAGIAVQWLVYRVAFDARVFADLATAAAQNRLDFAGFDAAMLRLRLMPSAKAARDAQTRCRGALRLVRTLGFAVAVQAALVILGGVALASTAS